MSHGDHHQHHQHQSMSTPGDVSSESALGGYEMPGMHGMNSSMEGDHTDHMNHMNHMNHEGGMGHMNHSGHMDMGSMKMYFHASCDATILFEGWKISTVGGLIGSMVGIFIMAAMYEGLKYYREYLFRKTYQAIEYSSVAVPTDKGVVVSDGPKVVPKKSSCQHGSECVQCPSQVDVCQYINESSNFPYKYLFGLHITQMFSWIHLYQTFLHVIQVVLSYFLMLIFMTYNVWLCLAVALGAALGYFIFGWKKSVVVDITEHCH